MSSYGWNLISIEIQVREEEFCFSEYNGQNYDKGIFRTQFPLWLSPTATESNANIQEQDTLSNNEMFVESNERFDGALLCKRLVSSGHLVVYEVSD